MSEGKLLLQIEEFIMSRAPDKRPEIRVGDFNFLEVWNTKERKYRKAGYVTIIDGRKTYISRHKEILFMWNSLGVTERILKFIEGFNVEEVRFVVGEKAPYVLWDARVQDLLKHGRPLWARNEQGNTLHLPLNDGVKFIGKTSDIEDVRPE